MVFKGGQRRIAAVTGAAGFLGPHHINALLDLDYLVYALDIDQSGLSSLKDRVKDSSKVRTVALDLTIEAEISDFSGYIDREYGHLSALINNAAIDAKVLSDGLGSINSVEEFSLARWEFEHKVGLTSVFLMAKYFGKQMSAAQHLTFMVNMASDLSVIAPNQRLYVKGDGTMSYKPITYSSIKSGILGLTRYLATYWENSSLRVNSISPGGVYNNQDPEFVDKVSSMIPLGRMANPEEIASAVSFLCSNSASYIHGSNLIIDGGRTIW